MTLADHRSPSLAIGPANYAGQAYHWADALQTHCRVDAHSFAPVAMPFGRRGNGAFQFPVHRRLPHHRTVTSVGRRIRMARVLKGVTHVAIDGFLPVYSRFDRADLEGDVRKLRKRGLKVALIAHGSDIRDPDLHMARYGFSFYRNAPDDWVDTLRRKARTNRELARSLGMDLFVSTPDLLLDAPHATWLPLCVDADQWANREPVLKSSVPRVLHIPSRRNPPIKGTEIIDPILRRLADEGRIDYKSPASANHSRMPDLVRSTDIVVEQILVGSYGVAAVEGMAAGRLVVGFVGSETRARIPDDLPIIDARPADFETVLRSVVANRADYIDIASSGPSFVERWHTGRASSLALERFIKT
jgi:hypothetical protein